MQAGIACNVSGKRDYLEIAITLNDFIENQFSDKKFGDDLKDILISFEVVAPWLWEPVNQKKLVPIKYYPKDKQIYIILRYKEADVIDLPEDLIQKVVLQDILSRLQELDQKKLTKYDIDLESLIEYFAFLEMMYP